VVKLLRLAQKAAPVEAAVDVGIKQNQHPGQSLARSGVQAWGVPSLKKIAGYAAARRSAAVRSLSWAASHVIAGRVRWNGRVVSVRRVSIMVLPGAPDVPAPANPCPCRPTGTLKTCTPACAKPARKAYSKQDNRWCRS
jgi:hypothetical protein